jgi:hypothetical protein
VASRQEVFRVITIVRNPLARNLSAWKSLNNCRQDFVKEFNHEEVLTWFDREIKRFMGIDVFAYEFDTISRWMTIKIDQMFPLLIMRTEDLDETGHLALRGFIPLQDPSVDIEIPRKAISNPYERPPLPTWLLDKMLQSRYCRHFYTDEEIQNFYREYQNG